MLQLLVLVIAGAAILNGCATPQKARVLSVAVAVTTFDGRTPSQEQVARILSLMGPEIARAGFKLARATVEADFIVTVKFTQDVDGTGGHVSIATMEPIGQFRGASGVSESDDMKEARRRLREMDAWALREMTRTNE